jgi:gas vesicle protein
MPNHDALKPTDQMPAEERGGFVGLALLAAAIGAGAALLLAPSAGSRRRSQGSRREKRIIALAGVVVGAGLAALLTPESGPATRKLIGGTLSRIKVGAVDRIERLRQTDQPEPTENPVRSVQELGRDSNDIF